VFTRDADERLRGTRRCLGATTEPSDTRHLAAEQFDPEFLLPKPQPLPIVVFDLGPRQACVGADPGVDR